MERYHELDSVVLGKKETKEELIKKLMDISYEKKQIQTENNAIIKEYVEVYEKFPERLDAGAEKLLKDFLSLLIPSGQDFLDTSIALRISKILLHYYRTNGNLNELIMMLEKCAVFDIMLKEHLDDYEGSEYICVAEQYLSEFDHLSESAKRSLANCYLLSVVNRKDMTFGIRKYREIREKFGKQQEKMGGQFMEVQYVMCKVNALAFALESCRRMAYAKKKNQVLGEPALDMDKDAELIGELSSDLRKVLASEKVQSIISDRVLIGLYCAQADYHLGKITLEELLCQIAEYSVPKEDYNIMEKCTALFTANSYYMDYLCKCSRYGESYILEKSMEIVTHVLASSGEMVQYFGNYQTNYCVLMLVNSASNIVGFDFFKTTVLNATVFANKALYVHTMMVKEICIIILNYILEHDPQYLDGVGGYDREYCKEHKDEILGLMENCALFHDIGKYFCLDYVSNASRNLTDDEFEVIKAHPANFSKIYQGKMDAEVECIHDCALLHHLWYNECGGYPKEKHTKNKPFVNILSIADSIDAATDHIGRPYGLGKTLEQLTDEFDSMKDTRYSGYICGLLHLEEVKREIEYAIDVKRKEIYCDIYLSSKE